MICGRGSIIQTSFSMHLFQKLFSGKYNRDAAMPNHIIEEALSSLQSATIGANTRQRVFSIIEMVEAGDQPASRRYRSRYGGADDIHPKLIEEIRKRPDGQQLSGRSIFAFQRRQRGRLLNAKWPARVAKYKYTKNTEEILREKAVILATFVSYNLDAGMTEIRGASRKLYVRDD